MHIDGGNPSRLENSGLSIFSRNCLAYVDIDSRYLLLLSECMVSKANDDLPDPDNPVTTDNEYHGISTSTFFKLLPDAPLR